MVRIFLIGLGSPAHYAVWNDLSCESLAGDLRGHFKSDVLVQIATIANSTKLSTMLSTLRTFAPDIVGLSLQPGSLTLADMVVDELRKTYGDSELPLLVLGNQLATYFPKELIKRYVNYKKLIVVRGEGEIALRSIVDLLLERQKIDNITSIVYYDSARHIVEEKEWVTPRLELLPHAPSIDTCIEVVKRGGNAMVQASRGCSWGKCCYCTRRSFRNGSGWEGFTIERVSSHLTSIVQTGVTEIEFCDDEFFGGRAASNLGRIRQMISAIKSLPSAITFRIFTRPEIIYDEADKAGNQRIIGLLKELKGVGLTRIYLGVESGSPSQLLRYCRGATVTQCEEAIDIVRKLGIGLDIGFILFDPEMTLEEMMESIHFFQKNALKRNNQWPFRPLVLNQGSRLLNGAHNSQFIVCGIDIDHISFKYVFNDLRIQYLHDIIYQLTPEGGAYAQLMYALKVLSKRYFDPRRRTTEIDLAQKYVEDHCQIFIDMIIRLGEILINVTVRNESAMKAIVDDTKYRIVALNNAIFDSINEGAIIDADGYIKKQLLNLTAIP